MKSDIVREWLVERAALGEAPAGTVLTPAEERRLDELTSENEAILSRYPPAGVRQEVLRRERLAARTRSAPRRLVPFVLAPTAAAAAVLLLLRPGPSDPRQGTEAGRTPPWAETPRLEDTRLKGQALRVYRKTPSGAEPLRTGDRVAAGDRLQLGYRLDAARYLVILSVDGAGGLTLHLPERPTGPSPRFEAGQGSLPFSYELDDAPGFERFFLITSSGPFSVEAVLDAARQLSARADAGEAPLEIPPGLSAVELTLVKEARP